MGLGESHAVTLTKADAVRAQIEIWGVLNVTPDSFSDGGRFLAHEDALRHARAMLSDGADVIDVGGASSRPRGSVYGAGAEPVSVKEELARVVPVVRALAAQGARVSIDTTQAEVAEAALEAGARIVNDVSCAANDALLDVVVALGAEYVLMHTRGGGEVEPPNTTYGDVVGDVLAELLRAVERLERRGVMRDRLWIDPGLGFAKTAEQSLALLAATSAFAATGLRVLSGASRKGFLGELARLPNGERPAPSARDAGTAAAVTVAVLGGARAVRVHDVAGGRQAALIAHAVRTRAGGAPPC
jgi:dihydropteroate synthase